MGHGNVRRPRTARSALSQLEAAHFDVAFLDLKLGAENGLELLPQAAENQSQSGRRGLHRRYASIENAVEAMRAGAVDYIAKPFTPEQIRQVLGKIVRRRKARRPAGGPGIPAFRDSPTTDLTTVGAGGKRCSSWR